MSGAIPTFYLYGEPHRTVDSGFIHVESLDDRTRPSEWTIQPHAHAELHHIFLVEEGGGTMRADGRDHDYIAPALLMIPARQVHGFFWARESRGWVATLAQAELDAMTRGEAEIAPLFDTARAIALSDEQATSAAGSMRQLMMELGWSQPGRHAALRAHLIDLLVIALRGALVERQAARPPGRHGALVARYRERLESRFRLREPVHLHAAALGIGESTLRAACARVAGQSPAAMLDQRALLEAQRALLYSSLPIAEIGYSLGFPDPAYFTRFFTRNIGLPPSHYRRSGGAAA